MFHLINLRAGTRVWPCRNLRRRRPSVQTNAIDLYDCNIKVEVQPSRWLYIRRLCMHQRAHSGITSSVSIWRESRTMIRSESLSASDPIANVSNARPQAKIDLEEANGVTTVRLTHS